MTDLPTHPRTGLTAIGLRRNGDPIWPVMGGAETEDDPTGGTGTEPGETDDGKAGSGGAGGDEPLGAAGTKALEAEKERRRQAAEGKRAAEAALATAQAELAQLRAAQSGDADAAEKAKRQAEIDTAVKQATDAANTTANRRVLAAQLRAAAVGKLANPDRIGRFIDLDQFEFGDDGTVAASDISDAIAELLRTDPYLAAPAGQGMPSASEIDAGPRGNGDSKGKPRQVTEAELKTMTPEQIVKAQDEGRLATLLGG